MKANRLISLSVSLIAIAFMSACDSGGGSGSGGNSYYDQQRIQCEQNFAGNQAGINQCIQSINTGNSGGYAGQLPYNWEIEIADLHNEDAFENYMESTGSCNVAWFGDDCDTHAESIILTISLRTLTVPSEAFVSVYGKSNWNSYLALPMIHDDFRMTDLNENIGLSKNNFKVKFIGNTLYADDMTIEVWYGTNLIGTGVADYRRY